MATLQKEFEVPASADAVWDVLRDFGGRTTHHNASAQVLPLAPDRCRFVWTTDLLPDAIAPAIGQMMEAGARAMRSALTPRAR